MDLQPLPDLTAGALYKSADALTAWIAQHVPERGLAPLLTALQGRDQALPAVCRRIYDALRPLVANGRLSPATVLEIATRVVGLGEGLTPSGDDLFVGLLAVLRVTARLEDVLPGTVRQQVLQVVLHGTSELSAAFIRRALEGDFAEPVGLLVGSLFAPKPHVWPSHAASLAVVGHSSGVDAMVGMVLGSRLLAHELEHKTKPLT